MNQKQNIHLQLLEPKHAKQYRELWLLCLETFPKKFGFTFEDEKPKPKLKWEVFLEEGNENNFMAGAFSGNELVGILGFIRRDRKKTKHKGEVVQMFVHPDFTGRKIASRLLEFIIEKCFSDNEIEELTLSVVANNESAIYLYKKFGFVNYAMEENYFKDGNEYTDQNFMRLTREKFNSSFSY